MRGTHGKLELQRANGTFATFHISILHQTAIDQFAGVADSPVLDSLLETHSVNTPAEAFRAICELIWEFNDNAPAV